MKKRLNKKLALNKQTISRLNEVEMTSIGGGTSTVVCFSLYYCETITTITYTLATCGQSCAFCQTDYTCQCGGGGGDTITVKPGICAIPKK